MREMIRQFKALPISKAGRKKCSKEVLRETMKYGFVYSPEVCSNYSDKELSKLIPQIAEDLGLSGEQANSTFHKSWHKVKTAKIEQLAMEQLLHYFTTYGFEMIFGTYTSDLVYVPLESLQLPKLDVDKFLFTVIKGYTKDELKQKLKDLLSTGIALKEDTQVDITEMCKYTKFKSKDVDEIRNKEIKIRLYVDLNEMPENPIEFLRLVIYKATNKTLIITNRKTLETIKNCDSKEIERLFSLYIEQYGIQNLSKIFYRFKPLFLAFRFTDGMKVKINRIRRLAPTYHEPMKEDYLNSITGKIKQDIVIQDNQLNYNLGRANLFRKVRLAYALKFRANKDSSAILYKVRNGKGYATPYTPNQCSIYHDVYTKIIDNIAQSIKPNVIGKVIYIPHIIKYALPSTEKQFVGNIPMGSSIFVDNNMMIGIHWNNIDGLRTDLDLSLTNADGKYGWDARWRKEGDILFSGDVTDAPLPYGASEFFYIKKQSNATYLVNLNHFNWNTQTKTPYTIIIAKESTNGLKHNYMVNQNNILFKVKSEIGGSDTRQKMLGLLETTLKGNGFYFCEIGTGDSISVKDTKYVELGRKYVYDFYRNAIDLETILIRAGAKITRNKEKCDVSLAPEDLEKDTIIKLLIN